MKIVNEIGKFIIRLVYQNILFCQDMRSFYTCNDHKMMDSVIKNRILCNQITSNIRYFLFIIAIFSNKFVDIKSY